MSRLNDIADAVADYLNGLTIDEYSGFSLVGVERSYNPRFVVEENRVGDIKIFVMSADNSVELERGNRDAHPELHIVNVAMYCRISRGDDGELMKAELDGLMDFRQEVMDSLKANRRLPAVENAFLTAMPSTGAAYDVDILTKDTFVSLIRLEYTLLA